MVRKENLQPASSSELFVFEGVGVHISCFDKVCNMSLKDGMLKISLDGCTITLQSSDGKPKTMAETPCKKRKAGILEEVDEEVVVCTPFPGIIRLDFNI
jgi:hypothetical protein